METSRARIFQFIEKQHITSKEFLEKTGLKKGFVDKSHMQSSASDIHLSKILEAYPSLSAEWLLTGAGEMLKIDTPLISKERNVIPLYEDVQTIGGISTVANTDPIYQPSEFIDAGDWFPGATAAIRHYGDSMTEYPSGCILALKEVVDRDLIIWGRNYCIETAEYRITKKLYNDGDTIAAISSNEDTYGSNGRLIHPEITIPKNSIRKMFLVLGYVVKEYSNGPVFITK